MSSFSSALIRDVKIHIMYILYVSALIYFTVTNYLCLLSQLNGGNVHLLLCITR
jgi:hypothetical protein